MKNQSCLDSLLNQRKGPCFSKVSKQSLYSIKERVHAIQRIRYKQMYKVKYDLVPSYISEIFTRKGTRYNLRNSDFEIPRFNTIRYGKHTLRYQGPYIWSKLENGMRELPSLSIFKTKIRRVDLASLVEDSGNCCNLCST